MRKRTIKNAKIYKVERSALVEGRKYFDVDPRGPISPAVFKLVNRLDGVLDFEPKNALAQHQYIINDLGLIRFDDNNDRSPFYSRTKHV